MQLIKTQLGTFPMEYIVLWYCIIGAFCQTTHFPQEEGGQEKIFTVFVNECFSEIFYCFSPGFK